MKEPKDSDFTVTRNDAGVAVTFNPTKSRYSITLLADPEDIGRYGPIFYHRRISVGRCNQYELLTFNQ
jgi:hypothetical protein